MSYSLDYTLIDELKRNLDCIIEKENLQNRFVVMFGNNVTSDSAISYLHKKGIKTAGIIDNNKSKNGTICGDIRISFPEELLSEFNDDAAILIGSSFYREMCTQLEKIGYIEGKHIFEYINFTEMKDKYCKCDLPAISTEEQKKIQLEMLIFVRDMCNKNGLRYYLSGGTLLGAIRHKGYIPWDDDIDLLMPQKDLIKLVDLLRDCSEYTLLNPYTSSDYYFECAKLIDNRTISYSINYPLKGNLGVNIDLFPLCGLPDDTQKIDEYFRMLEEMNTEKWKAFYDISDSGTPEEIFHKIISKMQMYDLETSKYAAFPVSRYSTREVTSKGIYDDVIQVEFEGELFSAAKGYEEYLINMYDDYMKLPPEENRVATHQQNAYWNTDIVKE